MSTTQSTIDFRPRTDTRDPGISTDLPIATYTCNPLGHITHFNERAVELWGRRPALADAGERFCGAFALFTVDGLRVPREKSAMALALQNGSKFDGREFVVQRADGSCRHVLAYASPIRDDSSVLIGATCALVDITERVAAEKSAKMALQASEANFRGFFDSVAVGACQVGADGRFIRINDRYCELTGYSREELLTMGPLDLDHPDDREADKERVVKFLTETPGLYRAEKRYIRKDGSIAWVRVAANLLRSEDSESVQSAALVEDISERKRAEQALQDADRLKDEFIATLAHELRNPLAPLQTGIELLRLGDSSHTEWCHGVIERQVKHLTRLVSDLLDISRITSNKLTVNKQSIELADVIHAAVESTRPILDKCDQRLIVSLPDQALHLDGDLVRLAQVFANLLSNAAKFTEGEGTVRLTARATASEIEVTVADSGIGMSFDELAHAFDKFYQGSRAPVRSVGGLGVGLSLVRQLVELHGGTIEARSAGTDRGSEFVVRLPARMGAAPAPTPSTPVSTSTPATRRVLIVDDNRDGAQAIARLLRSMGHEVATAYDGHVALDCAKHFEPHVVLLDLGMPEIDGFEVCKQLRAHAWCTQRPNIVALTGWGRERDLARTSKAGFDGHLVKPVDAEALEKLLELA
jgi:PAS domain S-box-containing protein